jgi:hypothetical protein
MGTKFWEVVCDENGIGGGRINVFYHEAFFGRKLLASRGSLRPRARRDRRCNPKSPLGGLLSPENLVNHTRGQKMGQRPLQNR